MDFESAMRAAGGDVMSAAAMVFAEAPEDKRGADETFGDSNPADRQSMRGYDTDDTAELSFSDDDDEPEPLPEGLAEDVLVPGVLRKVLMHLDPTELKRVCATNSMFRAVCRDTSFRRAYLREWYVNVMVAREGSVWFMTKKLKTDTLYDAIIAGRRQGADVPTADEFDVTFAGERVATHSNLGGMRAYTADLFYGFGGALRVALVKPGTRDEPTYVYPGESRAGTRFILPGT